MEIVILAIALVSVAVLIFYSNKDKQNNKAVMIALVSKSLLELTQNQEILRLILIKFKPNNLMEDLKDDIYKQDEKKSLPICLEPPIFVYEETERLKNNNDFLVYSDLSLSIELNNLLLRIKYLNQLFPDLNSLNKISDEEYKTIYNTHKMTVSLVKSIEAELNKLKR
ncbi:hypothetical protein [Desulfallas thermosapovorans]|uniref:Uncharacterized protein n=1 Tax=Desulfallas thermosapovorans DSM 6562 TaxID=1121431 RepID=A0A5S4ZY24_9FIRM|nr:hypothetical protein [Desulfallas thermosapovorans]TYO97027.1 hypothetical protein LX24_00839 [Desulfallas thermosapovorans DSM 6562]